MPFKPGQSGNPHGRPGTLNLRTQEAIETFQRFKFNPLEEKIALAKSVKGAILRADEDLRLEYRRLYAGMLATLLRYCFPQLKQVEHTGRVEHVHTTEELAQMSDVELEAYVITVRAQLEEPA